MNDSTVLKAIFEKVESTVIATGDRKPRTKPIRDALWEAAMPAAACCPGCPHRDNAGMPHSDRCYFRKMVHVIFYAGMRAATVSKKIPAIDRRFPSYSVAAGYGEKDISAILDDPEMLRNKRKIRTCIDNARKFAEVVTEYGSFAEYLRKIESVEDLWTDLHKQKTGKQKTDLYKQKRFKFLGRIISFHYLMEVGYDLVKPDIVLARVFSRLRLVNGLPNPLHPDPQKLTDEQLWQIVRVGQQIAKSTQLPIRYVDLVFAVFGQMEGQDPEGLPQGICLDEKPKCCRCEVRDFCRYEPKTLSAPL